MNDAAMPAGTTTLRFALDGRIPLQEALPFAETVKKAVHRTALAALGALPRALDDHPPEGLAQRHAHPWWLPEDTDRDGWADHLVIHVPRGVTPELRDLLGRALERFEPSGRLAWQGPAATAPGSLMRPARRWRSLTPFVANVHLKRGRGPAWALRRELAERQMPTPLALERLEDDAAGFVTVRCTGTARAGRSLHAGAFFRLVFPEPVPGPLAFGFAGHLGLGLFRREPADDG